jgi:rhodanese-related sulfurtransferase
VRARAGTFVSLASCVLLLAGLACARGSSEREIAPSELLSRSDAPLVLDVRSAEEFAGGHVPGARNVAYDEVAARLVELGPPREVVVYCESGKRAAKAADALAAAGFTVLQLRGHIAGWRAAGLPVER